ncbi:calmodulin-regulated spectrin-associated protein patronin isoform X19 [Rhodnius prolixus]|uniref:calmodulin-regulated spectrin-associated protein patronin isoform X19 n=1 Tax=Rhodnius prolixus TaxID=13249 RepID=UPI003D18E603
MWGAISRLFHKQNGTNRNSNEELIMDKGEPRKFQESEPETYGTRQAKQRATVKWLLSKAFNNRIPENLLEPFYRNHEDQELLKPQLVHWLANAELYCMALSNIYSDPNYHNLNHCGVLQALSRKGVYISDPHITETVLIQTTPIKLSAHQTVMQAVMTLYAKEVATPEFVYAAVKRFMPSCAADEEPSPTDYEHALLFWINHATSALRLRVEQEERTSNVKCPEFPKVSSLQDLCDGVSLCGLVSFYCPEELPWSSISVSQVPTVSDCVRNLTLVHDFCARALPAGIFHMSPEDVYYMRGSMKHNLVVFLADLFNMLEIHPAPCVTLNSSSTKATINAEGRNSQGVAHKRSLPQTVSAIPDLRSSLDTPSSFSGSPILSAGHLKKPHVNSQNENCVERNEEDEFVVHRGRSVPTLSSVTGSASDGNRQAEHNDRVAGKPSNWEPRKQSFAGRRSRRNSLSDESQLTLENFGGSQENLHLLGRNPDKEPAVLHSGRRDSQVARSSVLDNNSDALTCALQDTYAKQQECRSQDKEKKVTSFAALPNNTTTWQQQSKANQNSEQLHDSVANDVVDNGIMGSQLMNIRMKLEEKRRRIESEKRRMEAQLNRQRQKVGKAAFLQAVSKAKVVKSPESDPGRETTTTSEHSKENKPPRPFSLQDITEVEQKWLSGDGFTEERKTPDMDNMDIETYQQSIAQMNSSLHEIQADLQRLANQQNQLQNNQIGQPLNQGNMGMPQVLQPQQQSQQPPQMQSFASLHQQAGYTTQHINFNSQPPQQQQQQQQYPMQQQQHYQLQSQQAPPPQQPPQPPQQQHEYFNGRLATFNTGHTQQQMQQMHSLMSAASNTGQQHYNTQQWHSLSQQSPQPPQQQPQQQQPNYNTYSSRYNQGFQLHNYEDSYHHRHDPAPPPPPPSHHTQPPSTQGEFYLHDPPTVQQRRTWGQPYSPSADSGWSGSGGSAKREPVSLGSSPKQPHYLMHNGGGGRTSPPTGVPTPPPRSSVNHAPLPTPPVDDMEPQSISFIGSGDDDPHLTTGLSKLNITSGSRTYRIPSPTRAYTPSVRNSFSQQHDKPEQGFYISFDDPSSQPKRPKPPLRTKRNSPKKERGLTQTLDGSSLGKTCEETQNGQQTHSSVGSPMTERPIVRSSSIASQECSPAPPPRNRESISESRVPHIPVEEPIVIGAQPDPGTLDEMEKKKERILMLSLQRRQAAEEARTLKEAEAARRRDQEKAREEEKLRKKEEEKRRRAVILEQYKIKKVIEEAEREGKQVDKELLHSLKMGLSSASGSSTSGGSSSGGPKMRSKTGQGRPRPKTIHIDSGADSHPGTITPSRDKKGSSSNLSVFSTGSSTMRRDYYRGSQDCLVETRKPSSARLYSEIGDESRGTSPGRSLGRRSSYKTSRDASPEVRTMGRPKYGTYQARRKSNSLMNLAAGSSCDQDSLVYRYGDTDSGLGRATPPRRVPSPSGPGSLPATHHRRLQPGMGRYDVADNVSDAGSDYTGPRLYRQPATKSNKGIVLNAVEYCVFPGAVNKEAKQRVIEEMNRSEAKHFLVLFRDAGCQFRALYAYYPETEEVVKLYGTGPKQVSDRMFDKFFKYNSGGKCFSQVHTKHLTVTIDAFTIHNSLWQGKKVNLPNKRDMTLVI